MAPGVVELTLERSCSLVFEAGCQASIVRPPGIGQRPNLSEASIRRGCGNCSPEWAIHFAECIIERIVGHDVKPVVPDVVDRKAGFAPELLLDLEVPLEELGVEKLPANVIEGGSREQRGCSLQVCQGGSVCEACLEGGIGLNVCVIQATRDDSAVDVGRDQTAIGIKASYV